MIYRSLTNINIYDSPKCDRLATQMAQGRYLQVLESEPDFLKIQLLGDDYIGLLDRQDFEKLVPSDRQNYIDYIASIQKICNAKQIESVIPEVIAFIRQAMATANEYLWGGTVAPNYDCSGLMQAAFANVGILIPRDAYQQEAFGKSIPLAEIEIGDLIFFGTPAKATHVGIYIGHDQYIHSSGKEHGHNGIAISAIAGQDLVSRWYAKELRGATRISFKHES
jgi:hypothetical protein